MSRRWNFWSRRGPADTASRLSCREMVELVTGYLEGALSEADRVRFETHLASCDDCTAYVMQMRETISVVGRIGPEDLDPDMERELLAAFRSWKSENA
jgi:anti-sigma factor RsiW